MELENAKRNHRNGNNRSELDGVDRKGMDVVANGDELDETSRLLSKKEKKLKRRVQWNDSVGNKLVEVLEYQPSDSSDSEDEDADSCLCSIM